MVTLKCNFGCKLGGDVSWLEYGAQSSQQSHMSRQLEAKFAVEGDENRSVCELCDRLKAVGEEKLMDDLVDRYNAILDEAGESSYKLEADFSFKLESKQAVPPTNSGCEMHMDEHPTGNDKEDVVVVKFTIYNLDHDSLTQVQRLSIMNGIRDTYAWTAEVPPDDMAVMVELSQHSVGGSLLQIGEDVSTSEQRSCPTECKEPKCLSGKDRAGGGIDLVGTTSPTCVRWCSKTDVDATPLCLENKQKADDVDCLGCAEVVQRDCAGRTCVNVGKCADGSSPIFEPGACCGECPEEHDGETLVHVTYKIGVHDNPDEAFKDALKNHGVEDWTDGWLVLDPPGFQAHDIDGNVVNEGSKPADDKFPVSVKLILKRDNPNCQISCHSLPADQKCSKQECSKCSECLTPAPPPPQLPSDSPTAAPPTPPPTPPPSIPFYTTTIMPVGGGVEYATDVVIVLVVPDNVLPSAVVSQIEGENGTIAVNATVTKIRALQANCTDFPAGKGDIQNGPVRVQSIRNVPCTSIAGRRKPTEAGMDFIYKTKLDGSRASTDYDYIANKKAASSIAADRTASFSESREAQTLVEVADKDVIARQLSAKSQGKGSSGKIPAHATQENLILYLLIGIAVLTTVPLGLVLAAACLMSAKAAQPQQGLPGYPPGYSARYPGHGYPHPQYGYPPADQ